MESFEGVYRTLETLLTEKLPDYIEEVNKRHGDGIFISPFENRSLAENCAKVPCFKFSKVEADFTEKDRIVESTVFEVCLTLCQKPPAESRVVEFWRYVEAVQDMVEESETGEWETCKVDKVSGRDVYLRIEVNRIGK